MTARAPPGWSGRSFLNIYLTLRRPLDDDDVVVVVGMRLVISASIKALVIVEIEILTSISMTNSLTQYKISLPRKFATQLPLK